MGVDLRLKSRQKHCKSRGLSYPSWQMCTTYKTFSLRFRWNEICGRGGSVIWNSPKNILQLTYTYANITLKLLESFIALNRGFNYLLFILQQYLYFLNYIYISLFVFYIVRSHIPILLFDRHGVSIKIIFISISSQ